MSVCQTLTVNQVRTGTCYINRKQNYLRAVLDIFQEKPRGRKKFGQFLSFNNCLPRIKMVRKMMTRSVFDEGGFSQQIYVIQKQRFILGEIPKRVLKFEELELNLMPLAKYTKKCLDKFNGSKKINLKRKIYICRRHLK